MIKKIGVPAVCFFIALFSAFVCAHGVDQDISDMYPSADISDYVQQRAEKERKRVQDDFIFSGYIDIQQGYDNNVNLDADRRKDGFLQNSFNTELTYKGFGDVYLRTGVDIFNILYYRNNDNNLLDVAPYLGLDWAITPDLIWKNRVIYDYFSYPNRQENSYNGLALATYLRHYFHRDIYHEAGFEYLKRWYTDRKISLHTGLRGSDKRADNRYRMRYNLGFYGERYFVRLNNEAAYNESNDMYQDYYDYWLYRVRPSVMFFITDKLYTDLSFIYRHTRYKDRRSTEDPLKRVRDNTFIATASLYYDIVPDVTIGVTYSYTENSSNDPFQEYSGSVISGGIFYNF